MITIENLIENFHLEEKEAKVYLASLQLGKSRASEIAKKAGLNRITVYEILKRFRAKGLATSVSYRNILLFSVIDPEHFYERMKRQLELSKKYLPSLLSLKGGNQGQPKIEYYDGAEGIRSIYEDTLFCEEKVIYDIAHPENTIRIIGEEFLSSYIKKRMAKKILAKVLVPEIETSKFYTQDSPAVMREIKFFDNEKYPIPNEIMIYDNKVAMLSFLNKIGIIIEDPEIAKSMKAIWSLMWDNSNQAEVKTNN